MPTPPRSPRVLLVAPQPFFTIAGTPLNISNMCRVLTEIGYEVHIATLPLGKDIDLPGLVYHRVAQDSGLDQVPIGFSFAKAIYDVLLAAKTISLLRRERFAAVHAIEDAALFAAPIARWFRTPMVVDLDSDICGQLRGSEFAHRPCAGRAGAARCAAWPCGSRPARSPSRAP